MFEKSYINLRWKAFEREDLRRSLAKEIGETTVDLIRDFGFLNDQFDEAPLDLPVVKWNDEGSQLLHLLPWGEDSWSLDKAELADIEPAIYYSRVHEARVVFYPDEVKDKFKESITVASIQPWGGPDNTSVITDFSGKPLNSRELKGLRNDLQRYRELIEQGRFEDKPKGPDQPEDA